VAEILTSIAERLTFTELVHVYTGQAALFGARLAARPANGTHE